MYFAARDKRTSEGRSQQTRWMSMYTNSEYHKFKDESSSAVQTPGN